MAKVGYFMSAKMSYVAIFSPSSENNVKTFPIYFTLVGVQNFSTYNTERGNERSASLRVVPYFVVGSIVAEKKEKKQICLSKSVNVTWNNVRKKLNHRKTFQLPATNRHETRATNKKTSGVVNKRFNFLRVINQFYILRHSSGHEISSLSFESFNFFSPVSSHFSLLYFMTSNKFVPFHETNNNKSIHKKIMVLIYKFHLQISHNMRRARGA